MQLKKIISFAVMLCAICSCKNKATKTEDEEISSKQVILQESKTNLRFQDFDTIIDNKKAGLYWLNNDSIIAAFTNYGGRLVGLWVPDKNGKMTDVVVGMNSATAYANSTEPYFGATIGRVGNRIAKGNFALNGKNYTIPTNNNGNTLHGGNKGFQYVVFDASQPDEKTLVLQYKSPDGEEGFPGNLNVKVTYSLTSDRAVKMEYEATTDQPTPVNLTNHAFFNLNGEGSGSILNHRVQIYADKFTPVDGGLIPSGELRNVANTPFDFTDAHTIGERIKTENKQLDNGGGYDHNFVLNENQGEEMNHAATVIGDKSGIEMNIYTQEPGLQFYSGNFMQSKNSFKSGATDEYRTSFAMETQHFPDAPNQPKFPSIILNPGDVYHTISIYRFDIQQ
ncbi:MAG: galactose-1-epimerase [Pseudooceanicola sp.]|nr:galactose-1-epimerase [Pseudooceanicola sp.]|tara:strand:- start:3017 stop:4198 length:1182 start_codon:yes stop_codon:yes gene_type:complete